MKKSNKSAMFQHGRIIWPKNQAALETVCILYHYLPKKCRTPVANTSLVAKHKLLKGVFPTPYYHSWPGLCRSQRHREVTTYGRLSPFMSTGVLSCARSCHRGERRQSRAQSSLRPLQLAWTRPGMEVV